MTPHRLNPLTRWCLLLILSIGLVLPAAAENRQALLIANGVYKNFSSLATPVVESADLAVVLKKLGFTVTLLKNASREQMLEALDDLGAAVKGKGGVAFFHYGGHGVQVGSRTYLIPSDADIPDERKVSTRALDVEEVMTTLDGSGADASIVVLDACRNNPLPAASGRSASRGLGAVGLKPKNSVIVYAAEANSTAQDGLFTPALTRALATPGLSLGDLLTQVRREVYQKSKGLQTPGEYNQLFETIYLAGGPKAEPDFGTVTVAPGSLTVSLVTAGTLQIAGKSVAIAAGGTLPVNKLAPGDYPLTVTYPDGQSESQTVTVTSGQTLAVGFTYLQAPPKPKAPQGFVFVQGGTFAMGDTAGGGDSNEKPVHQVTVGSFSIGATEVTQAQYTRVIGTNPSDFKGDNLPVEKVSWYDAVAYCNRLSQSEGLTPAYTVNGTDVIWNKAANGYRLPTEAEWEFAAKGGTQNRGTNYAGSNSVDDVAWYTKTTSDSGTKPVGTKTANELGLYDMGGNVWEWCWDWYGSYSSGGQSDPAGPTSGTNRVFRGGSWHNGASILRSAYRYGIAPVSRGNDIGFRVVAPSVR